MILLRLWQQNMKLGLDYINLKTLFLKKLMLLEFLIFKFSLFYFLIITENNKFVKKAHVFFLNRETGSDFSFIYCRLYVTKSFRKEGFEFDF